MTGKELTQIVGKVLDERGISIEELCNAIGVSQSAYSQWKNNGRTPKQERIEAIEKYLQIDLSKYETNVTDDEDAIAILQKLKDDPAYRSLCKSAITLSKSQSFEAAAFVERLKEGNRIGTSY